MLGGSVAAEVADAVRARAQLDGAPVARTMERLLRAGLAALAAPTTSGGSPPTT
jgi:hypothetical protein